MSGIYIHIPFCRKACHYCNFHFSTSLKGKEPVLQAILKEIDVRKDFLNRKNIKSIYLGGGTPSVLSPSELGSILDKLAQHYTWDQSCEITIEANPDDINTEDVAAWQHIGINRVSLGIQSFDQSDLEYMNRSHNYLQAETALNILLDGGLHNLSTDLIYGSPTTTDDILMANMTTIVKYKIPHISVYGLTVEENTPLHHLIRRKKLPNINEVHQQHQFEIVMDYLAETGYHQYEISNYALPGHESKHNSSYWHGIPYLGIGPGAHGYDGGHFRYWNVSHNLKYVQALNEDLDFSESEELTQKDLYNEFVMTQLRLAKGISLSEIEHRFPEYHKSFSENLNQQHQEKTVVIRNNALQLTEKGKLIADRVTLHFFIL